MSKFEGLKGMFSGYPQMVQNDNNSNQSTGPVQQVQNTGSALDSFLGSLGSQTGTNQSNTNTPQQVTINNNVTTSSEVAKGIMSKFGPKDRKIYVDNATEWVNRCLKVEPIVEFVYLMLIACNVLPLNLQTIDAQYKANKDKFAIFAAKVNSVSPLKDTDSRPQVNFNEIYTQLKRILQAYPISKKFEWDSVMSVPKVKEVADYIASSMNQFNTKVYPFFYFKGMWKTQETINMGPIVCEHMELWDFFLKWYYATQGVLFTHSQAGICFYDTTTPNPETVGIMIMDLGTITVGQVLAKVKDIVKYDSNGKAVEPQKFFAGFLPFIKNLILMNPYRLLLTSNFRLARAMGMHEQLQDAVVDMMMLQIEQTMELVDKGHTKFNPAFMDQQQLVSAEQLTKADQSDDSPNKILKANLEKIAADGAFNLEIEGAFMKAYFASQRIQKIFMRSMKRLLFGSGTGPNTRRWNKGQTYSTGRHGYGTDRSVAVSDTYSLKKLLEKRKQK